MAAKHIHKLRKHTYKTGIKIFFCTLIDCHYKVEAPLAIGKESICNICGNPFIMNEYTIKLTKPHCTGCGKVAIVSASGKKSYVRKQSTHVLAAVAENTTENLRSRLQMATNSSNKEDI